MTQIQTINPATDDLIGEYTAISDKGLEDRINKAHSAFIGWRTHTIEARSTTLKNVAAILEQEKSSLAKLITDEMGKPITESLAEIKKCVKVCLYYAENAKAFLADEAIDDHGTVIFQPLGVILGVMPWNFPFWQVFRFAAPTLAAGNTCLLKHASNVSGCALAIDNIFKQAKLPDHTFTTLLLESSRVQQVIEHPKVQAVSLTGSTQAGKKVAAQAGAVLKKSVLELGGSDPYIVLRDADIDAAAKLCATSRMINGGQSCISAKRFIVEDVVASDFENALADYMLSYSAGDPLNEHTQLGPMAKAKFSRKLHDQVETTLSQGGRLVARGEVIEEAEAYFPATILSQVPESSPAYGEEMFGPVATVIAVKNEQRAIEVANASQYGLGAAIFTQDIERAQTIARKVDAGCCAINDFVRSEPELPFGGIKQSGFGRELSHYGIKEFVNVKTLAHRNGESD